jgi:Cu+-exporting ATPase
MSQPEIGQIIDPVCGMHLDPEAAPAYVTYGTKTYYFCSDEHKAEFERNPERYAGRPAGYEDTGKEEAA